MTPSPPLASADTLADLAAITHDAPSAPDHPASAPTDAPIKAGSSSPLSGDSRASTPLSDADGDGDGDGDGEGDDPDADGSDEEPEGEHAGAEDEDDATSSTVPLTPEPIDDDGEGEAMPIGARRARSESVSDDDAEGEDDGDDRPRDGRRGDEDDDGSELTPEGSDDEDDTEEPQQAVPNGRNGAHELDEEDEDEDEEMADGEAEDDVEVEDAAVRHARSVENGWNPGPVDDLPDWFDGSSAHIARLKAEREAPANGDADADADADLEDEADPDDRSVKRKPATITGRAAEDDYESDDGEAGDRTITGPPDAGSASESTARRPSNGRITDPAKRSLADDKPERAVEDSDDDLSELDEEDGVDDKNADKAGKSGEDEAAANGEDDEDSMAREKSPSPSKSSAETPPPSATPNAPTYHLRGDPYHQVTAVPTAPTAEALASLLEVELKFARLRDGLYVERMNELAAEEMMIVQGDHPAIKFLHGILETRKNKLLEYAELRIKQAEAELNREMKAHRKLVLSTWADNREKLCDSHYEANARKKRKIEKDRVELDAHRPSLPVNPKPVPAKDPAVAERIMRGFDWSRGPVVTGGLSAATVNDDLARIGIRRPVTYYNGQGAQPNQYGMAPQPPGMHGGYLDPVTGRVTAAPVPQQYQPMMQDEMAPAEGSNGAYEHGGRVNGHHHHHHHHAAGGNVPAPAGSQASLAGHGGRPILGRPRYGHAATGVHVQPSSNGPVREGRTVPTSSQEPFDPNRRRPREREREPNEWPSKRDAHGISVEVDDAKRKREGLPNGGPSRPVYGGYANELGYHSGSTGTRSMLDAKAGGEHNAGRHYEPARSKDTGSTHPNGTGAGAGTTYSSSYNNGPLSSLGGGGSASARSSWPFGMYNSGLAGNQGSGAAGRDPARATEPVGGRNFMAR